MMRMVLAVLLFVVPGPPGPEVRHFRYERPVDGPALRSGQTCVALPGEVFAHASPGLADVRLYDGAREHAYAVRTPEPAGPRAGTISALNAGVRNGKTVFDAAMPGGKYSDVELRLRAQNFIATVSVSGSEGQGAGHETKLGSFTVFDLTKERLGRSTVLHMPETDFRHLHFEISGPVRAEEVEGLTLPGESAGEARYTTVVESAGVRQRGRESVMEFRVPAHVPVERVLFALGPEPAEFSREVHVTVRPEPERAPVADESAAPPEPVTFSGSVLRLHRRQDGQQIDEERLGVELENPGLDTETRWTVSVANGDDPPLGVESARLEMQERDLCFDAMAGSNYALYYGDPELAAARYDYAALYAPQESSTRAGLGPEELNPEFEARADQRPFTERHPALLWLALAGAIAVLGGVALRSAGHGKATS